MCFEVHSKVFNIYIYGEKPYTFSKWIYDEEETLDKMKFTVTILIREEIDKELKSFLLLFGSIDKPRGYVIKTIVEEWKTIVENFLLLEEVVNKNRRNRKRVKWTRCHANDRGIKRKKMKAWYEK